VNELRDAACVYADRGWVVFPLKKAEKAPLGSLVPNGMHDGTCDLAQVFKWWKAAPAANIGIACEASGLVVVDFDPRNGGEDALFELERELGALPSTPTALTGGGGAHVLLRNPGGSFRREIAPGVDIKANGYIVAPPSLHPSGKPYSWEIGPEEAEVADVPRAWLERMQGQTRRQAAPGINPETTDSLKWVPASVYAPVLTGRPVDADGWMQCPFHKDGNERTPSFRADKTLWACYACEPLLDKDVMGGNVFDLAALLWGYGVPLSPIDYSIVRGRLGKLFS
jgi:hypothetical protein